MAEKRQAKHGGGRRANKEAVERLEDGCVMALGRVAVAAEKQREEGDTGGEMPLREKAPTQTLLEGLRGRTAQFRKGGEADDRIHPRLDGVESCPGGKPQVLLQAD